MIQVQAHFISHYLHKVNIEREVQLQQIVNPKYTTEPGLLIFGGRGRWESVHNREPWDADGNRNKAIFTFDLLSHNHIPIAKYLSVIRDDWFKNLEDSAVLAREIFSSGCRPRLKSARA